MPIAAFATGQSLTPAGRNDFCCVIWLEVVTTNEHSDQFSVGVLQSVIEGVSDAVLITDNELDEPGPRILYVNTAFERMSGYRFAELEGKTPRLFQGDLTEQGPLTDLKDTLRAGEPYSADVINYRKDGTPYEVQWQIWAYPPAPAEPRYFISVQRDVTEERAILSHRKQLSLLHRVSESVANEGLDLDSVRRRVAELAMEITGADAAVVEEPQGEEMVYRAVAGAATNHIGLRLPIDGSLSGLVFRQQHMLATKDAEHDDRVHKASLQQIGMRSGILAPLMHTRHCYGVLKVYAADPARFTEADQQLLMLASHILASALFDAAAFDAEVRKRHLLLDAVPILLAYVDTEYRYEEVNAAHEQLYGLSTIEIRGRKLSDLLGERNFDRLRPYLDGAFAGQSMNFEIPILRYDGEEVLYNGNLQPHSAGDDSVIGCYLAAQDITKIKLAEVDFLTGLLNRRRFEEIARFMQESRKREGSNITFLMLDIDHFKRVNDAHGHRVGDEVLKDFGEILNSATRATDASCRWGGEEFALLLHGTDVHQALRTTERLLSSIRNHAFPVVGTVTASIGLAEAKPDESLSALQHRADAALYEAKRAGRDRVVADGH